MIRQTSLALAIVAVAQVAADRAEAQYTTAEACPPGQPCVVVQAQVQPQPIVQPYAQPTYTAQPTYAVQPGYVDPAYGQPQSQMTEVRGSRLRMGLVIPGIILIAAPWVVNWITGIVGTLDMELDSSGRYEGTEGRNLGWSWVPWIGPWVNAGYFLDDPQREGYVGIHITMGVLQAAGLLMCILGTVMQEETVEMRYVLGEDGPALAVLPWADQNGAGAQVSLTGW